VPDSDLPGNSAGFASTTIDISTLSPAAYPALALRAELVSSDVTATPELLSWELAYTVSEPSIGSVPFTMTIHKTIGTAADSSPIYKFSDSFTTDAGGELDISDLEWGVYTLTLNTASYDIAEACPFIPLTLSPGTSESVKLILAAATARSLRVDVKDVSGAPIVGADVTLSRAGVNESAETSTCGQVFFNDALASAADYTVEVSKSGYTSETVTPVAIEGSETLTVVLIAP
jgi:hypothetical protein